MDLVRGHYENQPYPSRDPADERHRLIEGSPSLPVEIDSYLFAGRRDWNAPFRALVAGGGTGDGLIMLAQKLADQGTPAEITYLDVSTASREIAEARARERALSSIRFVTGDLLTAPELGRFDYIDCCGVLHHLADPDAGFRALAGSLTPDGGMGLMVYAPYGRFGVAPLRHALRSLLADVATEEQAAQARQVIDGIGPSHPFARNTLVGDHARDDAGLHDLLLHPQERSYTVEQLDDALARAGLGIASFVEHARYDPRRYLPFGFADRVDAMDSLQQASLAEQLVGTMKTHIAYVTHRERCAEATADGTDPDAVPHLRNVSSDVLAAIVSANEGIALTCDGHEYRVDLPVAASRLTEAIDGSRSLGEIAAHLGLPWDEFAGIWRVVDNELNGFNLLHYSQRLAA